jgi:hypothetical protein
MIDLSMLFINAEGLTNLGAWLQHQEAKNVAPKLANARKMLWDCCVPPSKLCSEWAAQSSVHAHKPNLPYIATFIYSSFVHRCPSPPQTRIG